ncbi:MAG TPA: PQQ-binding-like beta-propeller repeat protein [Rhodanobacteraceae bacterium]|nr:PQQ-binding-like beta-propeller repeat protein [Rhodanobacteraceae bacterium]
MRISTRTLFVTLALAIAGVVSAAGATTPAGIKPAPTPTPLKAGWREFRFNDGHTGFNPLETTLDVDNVSQLQLGFEDRLGKPVLSSSPAVVNGIAYVASSDGVLWAFPADGCKDSQCVKPLWKSTSLGQSRSSPTVSNGIVYIGSQTSADNNDGKLSAFRAAGCGKTVCEPLWQGAAGKDAILQSSPTIANGWAYIGAFDGRLYAFPASGCGAALCQPSWIGVTGGTIESTPTVANGVVFVGSDDGFLYAFDARGCGSAHCGPRWRGELGDENLESPVFDSTPAVSNGIVYIGSAHALAAFNASGCGASKCPPLWQSVNDLQFFGGSPAVANGRVYIGLEENVAVFEADGCGDVKCGPEWLLTGSGESAAVASSPTIANGVVYAGRNSGAVFAWPAEPCGDFTCPAIWTGFINDRVVSSSPTVINGKLYIGSANDGFPEDQSGSLYVFELPE